MRISGVRLLIVVAGMALFSGGAQAIEKNLRLELERSEYSSPDELVVSEIHNDKGTQYRVRYGRLNGPSVSSVISKSAFDGVIASSASDLTELKNSLGGSAKCSGGKISYVSDDGFEGTLCSRLEGKGRQPAMASRIMKRFMRLIQR